MSNFMNNLVRNRKKGFTLVELIVVLVILAILLAILVPALTAWIDKAREKQILVEARTAYLACQTVASEIYGGVGTGAVVSNKLDDKAIAAAKALAQVGGTISDVEVDGHNKVTGMKYTDKDGTKTATLAGGVWTVS